MTESTTCGTVPATAAASTSLDLDPVHVRVHCTPGRT